MTSQTRKQIITIHILPNISRKKGNQAIKFGQLIECVVRNTFLENYVEKGAGKLVSGIILFFEKALYKIKM